MNTEQTKVSEWVDKLFHNTHKCATWINEVKEQVRPEDNQQIRNIVEILLDLLPANRETVAFLQA